MSEFGRGKWYNENKVGKLSHEGGEEDKEMDLRGQRVENKVTVLFVGTSSMGLQEMIYWTKLLAPLTSITLTNARAGRAAVGTEHLSLTQREDLLEVRLSPADGNTDRAETEERLNV